MRLSSSILIFLALIACIAIIYQGFLSFGPSWQSLNESNEVPWALGMEENHEKLDTRTDAELKEKTLAELEANIAKQRAELALREAKLSRQEAEILRREGEISQYKMKIEMEENYGKLDNCTDAELKEKALAELEANIAKQRSELALREAKLSRQEAEILRREGEISQYKMKIDLEQASLKPKQEEDGKLEGKGFIELHNETVPKSPELLRTGAESLRAEGRTSHNNATQYESNRAAQNNLTRNDLEQVSLKPKQEEEGKLEGKGLTELHNETVPKSPELSRSGAESLRAEGRVPHNNATQYGSNRAAQNNLTRNVQSLFNSARVSEIPGPTYDYRLFLHSALITKGHYENDVYIDVFAIANHYFLQRSQPRKQNKWVRLSNREAGQELQKNGLYDKLDGDVEKWKPALHCLVFDPDGNHLTTPVIFIPRSASVDVNVNWKTHIMRCKVTELLPPSTLYQKKLVSVLLTQGACAGSDHSGACAVLAKINISLPDGITGQFAPKLPGSTFGDYKPEPDKLVNVTLCAPGAVTPTPLFIEFVEYHRMIGFNHIHIGVHAPWESSKMKEFKAILWPAISAGDVTLHSTWTESLTYGDEGKQFFMHMCLYHSKRMSRWAAVFDFDEFLTPHTPNQTVMDIINQADDFGKKEICWIQLSSFTVTSINKKERNSIWPTQRFDKRSPPNENYKKSISNTQRIFTSGYHLPGACNHSSPKVRFHSKIQQERSDYTNFVARVDPAIAGMHHFMSAFRKRLGKRGSLTEDEFGKYYFQRLLQRIEEIDPAYQQFIERNRPDLVSWMQKTLNIT